MGASSAINSSSPEFGITHLVRFQVDGEPVMEFYVKSLREGLVLFERLVKQEHSSGERYSLKIKESVTGECIIRQDRTI